jgi:hypothetical protein
LIEGPDGFNYSPLFIVAEFWVDRKGEDFFGGPFADGEVSLAIAKRGEAALEMEGDRVVDLTADLEVCEVLA